MKVKTQLKKFYSDVMAGAAGEDTSPTNKGRLVPYSARDGSLGSSKGHASPRVEYDDYIGDSMSDGGGGDDDDDDGDDGDDGGSRGSGELDD